MTLGTVFNISRYAIHDGPGIRTTVFLKGCPLSCWWCHNPEGMSRAPQVALRMNRCIKCGACLAQCAHHAISRVDGEIVTDLASCRLCLACARACPSDAREIAGCSMTVEDVMEEIRKDIPFYDESGGGVTFSGGEPLMQPDFLMELLRESERLDLHRTVDTSGFAKKEILLEAAARTDLFLYDLKHMDSDIHRKYTGVANEIILDNLVALASMQVALRIRFPLIPGINDDRTNVEETAAFLRKLNRVLDVDLLPYHDVATSKYKRFGCAYRLDGLRAPDAGHLQEIAATLGSYGLRVTIGGNDHERTNPQTQTGQP